MPALKDLVHETSSGTGTGNIDLVNVNGKQSFNSAFGTGGTDVFDYYISNRDAAEWERGTGHMVDSNTLARDTVFASSNSNNPVNFGVGTKDVTNDEPAAAQGYRSQRPGSTTNDSASAGNVGEYISSTVASGSAVALSDAATSTITSISLTAGDWDVEGQFYMLITGGETIVDARAAVHDVAATIPSFSGGVMGLTFLSQTFNSNGSFPTGTKRFSLSTTTTVYLNGYVDWSGGTGVSGFGTIRARRVR